MFAKIVTVVFYVSVALFAFGLFLPISAPLMGVSAAILAILNIM